jgi:hypothetical protein
MQKKVSRDSLLNQTLRGHQHMKRLFLALLCCIVGSSIALGQKLPPFTGYTTVLPATKMAPRTSAAARLAIIAPVSPLVPNKSFDFTLVASGALGGATYSGTILGRNPLFRGQTTTSIPTQIVPLVITINDGTTTVTYDPTAPDACVPGGLTDVSVITGSPIFNNAPWTMNTVFMGNTQYIDAFQRAEFGKQGTGYHLILNSSVLGGQALSFGPGAGTNYVASSLVPGACGNIGGRQYQYPRRRGASPDHRASGVNGECRHIPDLPDKGRGVRHFRHQYFH